MTYMQHLIKNWQVAFHALHDFFAHFIHGLIPAIKIRHHQPERKRGEWTKEAACPFCGFQPWYEKDIHTLSFCPNCGADMRGEQE